MDERNSVIIQNYLLAEMHLKPGFKPDNPSTTGALRYYLLFLRHQIIGIALNASALDKNSIALASS
jgi:hypothetical protein